LDEGGGGQTLKSAQLVIAAKILGSTMKKKYSKICLFSVEDPGQSRRF
jgi:hypothetical protein